MRPLNIKVGALILAAVSCAAGCDYLSKCRETVRANSVSPDGKLAATVYAYTCGFEGRYVTHVNIHNAAETPRPDQYGLIQSGMVFFADGDYEVKVSWRDSRRLSVECPACNTEILIKKTEWEGISILY
jgi:hypothetical protein